jgi:hypothetical protein
MEKLKTENHIQALTIQSLEKENEEMKLDIKSMKGANII